MTRASRAQPTDPPWICDRCGRFSSAVVACTCRQPHDPVAVGRRHRDAVRRARQSDTAAGRRLHVV